MIKKMLLHIQMVHDNAVIPTYGSTNAAGLDLTTVEDVTIPGNTTLVLSTGLKVELHEGYEMQIRPRSGITLKTPLRVQLGTIDCDFRGVLGVIVDNISNEPYIVNKGTRIAQGVIAKINQADFMVVSELSSTKRGGGGFGSTGGLPGSSDYNP